MKALDLDKAMQEIGCRVAVFRSHAFYSETLNPLHMEKTFTNSLRRARFFWYIMMLATTAVHAQGQRQISGTVHDNEGGALVGVNITLKGTTQGTITDAAGNFALSIPEGDVTLTFSYIGYTTQDVVVGNLTHLAVDMQPDVKQLQDVVVIGYGEQDRRALTSSVGSVRHENIENLKVPTFENLLKGQVAGVQLSNVTGQPGAGVYIRVRGTGSINAQNSPLYVVDGYPIEPLPYNNQVTLLSFINPSDIESMTVLKDASASAIYGSRGSNGVVIVTTKSGKKGQTQVEVNSYYGFQRMPKRGRFNVMNAEQWATFRIDALEDDMRRFNVLGANDHLSGINDPRIQDYATASGGTVGGITNTYGNYFGVTGPGTRWVDYIYHENAPTQQYNVTVRSGTAKSRLMASMDYYSIDGIIRGSDYQRGSLRVNADVDVTDKLSLGLRINPTYNVRNLGGSIEGFPDGNVYANALAASPITPAFQPDGTPTFTLGVSPENFFYSNPMNLLKYNVNKRADFTALANAFLSYKIIDGLTFKTSGGTHLDYSRTRNVYPYALIGYPVGVFNPSINNNIDPSFTSVSAGMDQISNWLWENTLTYNKIFGDHSIEVLAGHSAQQQTRYLLSGSAGRYSDNLGNYSLARANRLQLPGGDLSIGTSEDFDNFVYKLESIFGRIFYSYKSKYDLSVSFRRDGSTRYSSISRWGTFPAFSAGWDIAQENFFRNVAPAFISATKLRASYGITGNNNTGGSFDYIAGLTTANYTFNNAQANGRRQGYADTGLKWEQARTYDIGLDLRFFNDRLSLQTDYYHRETYNLLLLRPIPTITGFGSTVSNIGSILNRGFELTLDGNVLETTNLHWTSNFNISFNHNEVLALTGSGNPIVAGDQFGGQTITKVGQPMGLFYGYQIDGVYKDEEEAAASGLVEGASGTPAHAGTLKVKDINGDGKINGSDYTVIGNPNPKFIYGFTNNVSYKSFDLSVQISGSYGNDVLNSNNEFFRNMDGPFNVYADVANRWRSPDNPGNGIYPTTNYAEWRQYVRLANSNWIVNGSHLKVNNVTLGYRLPVGNGLLKGFKTLRVYTSIQNALLLGSKQLNNPDASLGGGTLTMGYNRGAYPMARVYTFGLNFQF